MIKSYCKINLSLRIIKKLNNGLHDIQSNSVLINLYDEIKIKIIKKKYDVITFNGKFKKDVNIKKNSIMNTLKLLRSEDLIKKDRFYKILINKKIPVYSGLGGGSSNAAFLIKHFVKKNNIKKKLGIFTHKLGSDLRLFFYNQSFQKSLKTVVKYKNKYKLYFVIIYPNVKCSTKLIYSKVRKFSDTSKINFVKINHESRFIELIKKEKNDLEMISSSIYPSIKKIISLLSLQEGCYMSRMTGSGSACYGMFQSQKLAKLGIKKIKKKFPKYWATVTKTI
tara:strand:- start:3753 stop:4592 length:840 start_codon:yes stop_codon:yes gene_type:complete